MLKSTVILCLAVLASAVVAGDDLESILANLVMADFGLDSEYAEVRVARSNLSLEDFSDCEVRAYPLTQGQPAGRFPMQVEVFRGGQMVDKGSVSLDVTIFADLPVPVRNIERHEILSPDLFRSQRFEVTYLTEKILTDLGHVRGCRAKHNLVAGRKVSMTRIEKIPIIEKGGSVTIVGSNTLFEIRAKGVALEDGNLGESIRVRNSDSRKIISVQVVAPGQVEISL